MRGERATPQHRMAAPEEVAFERGFIDREQLDPATGSELWKIRPAGGAFPLGGLCTDGKRIFVPCSASNSMIAIGDRIWRWVP